MDDIHDGTLRPNVCILVVNSRGELFLGERSDEPGHWQFPQGGLEPTATLEENAFRELQEETGITRGACEPLGALSCVHEYRWSPEKRRGSPWVGQSQRFFVILFRGSDAEIILDGDEHVEFRAWRWCPPREVPAQVAPVRYGGYVKALQELAERFADVIAPLRANH